MPDALPPTMLAAVWPGDAPELRLERIPVPAPRRDEVLIKVVSCGVCHTDLHVLKGEVRFPGPAVLGHEVSGTVVAFGEGTADRRDLTEGQAVVGAFIMPCTTCDACRRGRDDLCANFFNQNRLNGTLYDGTTRLAREDGTPLAMYSMAGLAEYSVVPIAALAGLPAGLAAEQAAILGCAAFTAYGAVHRAAELTAGESVAVVAVGGVGSGIIQVARAAGASPIIAVDVSAEKLEAARALGAHEVVNSSETDAVAAVRELTGGVGVDAAFEALGRPQTFTQAFRMLADGGRMVAIGIAAGVESAQIEITPLVRRGQRVIGSFGARTREDLARVVQLAADGSFDVETAVTRRYTLAEANEAYQALARGEITGRAIVAMQD
ncbi:zinc-binding dehydrogenase [Nakamurella deserti]|uniref:zinc-binding dehydrogenase n=1 Tax=Nakamurella deserti TaxID=2164074 RepID=UPI00197BFBF7|nr:zinc-binding dehydrogenase [Nakamurella deserti]